MTGTPSCEGFSPISGCWICEEQKAITAYPAVFSLSQFSEQDPQLSAYTGSRIAMRRCVSCGFTQPQALPKLPGYFDRLYDQQWSEDWVEREFASRYKDLIFETILLELARRTSDPGPTRRLLDIGAHAGRFLHLAKAAGWAPEGIELNPRTAAFAARQTGLSVHRVNAHLLHREGKQFSAITITDVLEHIPEPLHILRTAAELLEPGGWVAVKVPCGSSQFAKERMRGWLGRRDLTDQLAMNLVHVSHFSPRSLNLALQKSGFKRIEITIGAPELTDAQFQPGMINRGSNILRRTVYQLARFFPRGIDTPLALNLQAYAQKA